MVFPGSAADYSRWPEGLIVSPGDGLVTETVGD